MAGTLWIGKELTTIYNQSTAEVRTHSLRCI